ncbi:MAG: protein-(glutamine-N5) methyltransferase, release factor-specific [Omnitrophica bacterium RIFCSPLOWO2_12_FULL_44_17]|uniref:Release factor glutamine methyltransferase n=1 Tax=Candidatus Danuiimicrobium aquiferis TaxID=1801832 RepID=A0A1G1KWZ0_9BACT|nr:MAG: protein-(glutamine-N5) methyltransferase, release factor-specific [Omnitrophica bacterium RIFCSPHIGHO2_02_FULL_45_28]OGW91053.1 MAG: protein-(glutamine-N5) methyltransferase, release factor-specific [Omnitrophica bacterium RIFCSPHIGHO2_12_FULL_44_12]OGW97401.1 MAG: protein-(glutamine-N5) methyltransferase, release factor-specific [Omnitrophica bacterium RIFCSPLOWO2_12_FULL_44_17]OGX04475.1 MAG: protein-(glutamine-N5) methyltransferase, release factor-specific [Omnitrophica bacterium RIFC
MKQKTILDYVRCGTDYLESHSVPEARQSAEALLSYVLEKPRWEIYLNGACEINSDASEQFEALLKKRAGRYPLQYLLKTVPFREVMIEVGEGCLIPRPETEILVGKACEKLKKMPGKTAVLDVGTGSGNIAISLAKECSNVSVIATDISMEALRYAKENALINGVRDRIQFIQTDLWQGIEGIRFDMIVANPPYLGRAELNELQPELVFEPVIALDGGYDGIDYFQRIVYGATGFLKVGGCVLFEVGAGQADRVAIELKQNGFQGVEIDVDDTGIKRIVSGVLS